MDARIAGKTIEEIVNTYSDMIMRLSYQHLGSVQDAEDVMQDVFFALLKEKRMNNIDHLKAWLIKVTINKCRDYLRKNKRRRVSPLEDFKNYAISSKQIEIMDEIFELKEIDKNIIYLFYYEGYSAAEIGKILKKSENAIYVRLTRAREKLKNILEQGSVELP